MLCGRGPQDNGASLQLALVGALPVEGAVRLDTFVLRSLDTFALRSNDRAQFDLYGDHGAEVRVFRLRIQLPSVRLLNQGIKLLHS